METGNAWVAAADDESSACSNGTAVRAAKTAMLKERMSAAILAKAFGRGNSVIVGRHRQFCGLSLPLPFTLTLSLSFRTQNPRESKSENESGKGNTRSKTRLPTLPPEFGSTRQF